MKFKISFLTSLLVLTSSQVSWSSDLELRNFEGEYGKLNGDCSFLGEKIKIVTDITLLSAINYNNEEGYYGPNAAFTIDEINQGKKKYRNPTFMFLGLYEWGDHEAKLSDGTLTSLSRHYTVGVQNRHSKRFYKIETQDDSLLIEYNYEDNKEESSCRSTYTRL